MSSALSMGSKAVQFIMLFWIQPYSQHSQYMPGEIVAYIICCMYSYMAVFYLSCQEIPLTGTNDFSVHAQRVWRAFFVSSISLDFATTVSSCIRSAGWLGLVAQFMYYIQIKLTVQWDELHLILFEKDSHQPMTCIHIQEYNSDWMRLKELAYFNLLHDKTP